MDCGLIKNHMSFGIHMLEKIRQYNAGKMLTKPYTLQGFAYVTSPYGKTLTKHEHCFFLAPIAFFDTTEVTDLSWNF